MSFALGVGCVACGYLVSKNRLFIFGIAICVATFCALMLFGENKFYDFLYFFFAAGISQVVFAVFKTCMSYLMKNKKGVKVEK